MQLTSGQKEMINTKNNGGFKMKKFIKNLLNKRLNNEKGLTLVELLAVIVILGIIAAIAVPAIGNIVSNSQVKAIKADAANIINAANLYYTDKGKDSTVPEFSQANGTEFIENPGSFTTYTVNKNLEFTGTATKGGVTVKITEATLNELQLDTSDGNGTIVEVTK
ncbi:type II secretion system protein [Ureibacillus sp. MALMAid1270]|uniref:type II secretion system protein n=1 Tax=Ureibacillus sp. MALMAid1270 TaxID=3411629 RepID=UPI003BA49F67